jgi:LDH2 family malate/lactate/ureidoglycolate dehydrogenase
MCRLYVGAGVSEHEAATVAGHQVAANLAGHDSHGLTRTPEYLGLIDEGRIVPGAPHEVLKEAPGTLLVDGNWGFGFVVTDRTLDLLLDKAAITGVAAASVRRQGHVGRLGAYTARAARAGMVAMLVADSGRGPKGVAPFGGSDRRLGTNPISIALPAAREGAVVLDMATATAAGGKIRLAHRNGEQVPEGWLVDRAGRPTTDPAAFLNGGSILPLGGDQGHKGYGLSFVVESIAAVLSGIGFGADPDGFPNDGIFLAVFDVERFRDTGGFAEEVSDFVDYVKASPPAPGTEEVLYPGELEARTTERRTAEGIPVSDGVWAAITREADRLGVDVGTTVDRPGPAPEET